MQEQTFNGSRFATAAARITLFGVALAALLALPAGPVLAEASLHSTTVIASTPPPAPALAGRVTDGREGTVATADVFAYELGTTTLVKDLTDERGHFRFADLPAGIYKIIAFKDGFAPAVELLMRRSHDLVQTLDLELLEDTPGDLRDDESYWEVRGKIPADVLREMQAPALDGLREPRTAAAVLASGPDVHALITDASKLKTNMIAHSGVEQLGHQLGDAKLATAGIGIEAAMGSMALGVSGQFQQLAPREPTAFAGGEVREMALRLDGSQDSQVRVSTSSGAMTSLRGGAATDVDLDRYQLQWSAEAIGGRTGLSAAFIDESNFYQAGWLDPAEVPDASRTLTFDGFYQRELSPRTSLETGIEYRQRESSTGGRERRLDRSGALLSEEETIGAYGLAETRLQPKVLVEYGLFSQVSDGELSLMPHLGMVVDLAAGWKARAGASKRTSDTRDDAIQRFHTAFYADGSTCRDTGQACYEVSLTREGAGDDQLRLGAVHREYAETLRVYFSRDFFDRLEGLYLVRGDQVPEVQFSLVRRLAPKILAKLESNIASGGGGIFYAINQRPYENRVRYLVTSLDTRFQQTSTGVFIAFHHLEQELSPMDPKGLHAGISDSLEMERLQLMLTQDLGVLADLAANWAVRLNMEVSRGSTPYTLTADDELLKKLTAGLSVSF